MDLPVNNLRPAIPGVPTSPVLPDISKDSAGKAAERMHYGWVHRRGRPWQGVAFKRAQAGVEGLGVMDPALCEWAQSSTPEDAQLQYLYLVPAMPLIVEKSQLEPSTGGYGGSVATEGAAENGTYGSGAGADGGLLGAGGDVVCSINQWVNGSPILAAGALVLGYFLLRPKRA